MTIDAVLADEDQRIGEHVHGDGQSAARNAHHEFVLFQLVPALLIDAHGI